MATTALDGRPAARPGRGPTRPTNRRWAIGMTAAALALWAFYTFAMPALSPDVAARPLRMDAGKKRLSPRDRLPEGPVRIAFFDRGAPSARRVVALIEDAERRRVQGG